MKSVNLNDSINVLVYTDTAVVFDAIADSIVDNTNMTNVAFLAGFAPVNMLNAASPNVLPTGIMLTVKGFVTADDEYNQVWIQDDTTTMHGILIYDSGKQLPGLVNVGHYITVAGTRSVYSGMSEIAYKALINADSTIQSPIVPMVVTGSTIGFAPGSTGQTEDDPNIEPYEGMLLKINNATITTGPTTYYEYICTDDNGATNFVIDDEVDCYIEFGNGNVLKGLNRKATKKPHFNVSDMASLEATIAAIK
jgi:hypothetical protein